jgi:hypothetical protein
MEDKKLVADFDGNCGRSGEIWLGDGVCDACGDICTCLQTDASEGEYNAGKICFECIQKAFLE